jgi:hypothetical protein
LPFLEKTTWNQRKLWKSALNAQKSPSRRVRETPVSFLEKVLQEAHLFASDVIQSLPAELPAPEITASYESEYDRTELST